jgi:hypothetical protein
VASYATTVWPFAHFDTGDDPTWEYVEGAKATDGLGAAGFYPQNSPTQDMLAGVERDAGGNLVFKDSVLGSARTLSQLATATSGMPVIDFLLDCDPVAGNFTYAVTYSGSQVTQEDWTVTSTGKAVKRSLYTYAGSRVSSEVVRVFAADGVTVLAQTTETYSYSGNKVVGSTKTRDI